MIMADDEPTGTEETSDTRKEWARPEFRRLDAGLAELGDISNPEGNGQFS